MKKALKSDCKILPLFLVAANLMVDSKFFERNKVKDLRVHGTQRLLKIVLSNCNKKQILQHWGLFLGLFGLGAPTAFLTLRGPCMNANMNANAKKLLAMSLRT